MKKGNIISAVIGGTFFAVPYAALGMGMGFSLVVGALAFGAGNLIFSDSEIDKAINKIDTENDSLSEVIAKAKKMNSDILGMINKVEDDSLKQNIREVYQTANKIITAVEKSPKKMKYVETFFSYYLPETLKLLRKYDEIENQRLGMSGEAFMEKARNMVEKIKIAFKEQLAHIYQEDIIDTNAEMKVFDSMIKSEGFGGNEFKK